MGAKQREMQTHDTSKEVFAGIMGEWELEVVRRNH